MLKWYLGFDEEIESKAQTAKKKIYISIHEFDSIEKISSKKK